MRTVSADEAGGTAAAAAASVPGVAALRPGLRSALAGGAVRRGPGSGPHPGVRVDRSGSGAWRVEVRCALRTGRRVLDVAREVRERVAAAVGARTAVSGTAYPVTVVVDVVDVEDPAD